MKEPTRRQFLKTLSATAAVTAMGGLRAQPSPAVAGFSFEPDKNIIPAPKDPRDWPAFRQRLGEWRQAARAQLRYDDALYRREDFAWVTTNFSCCFLMMCDELFYDPKAGRYTVERFLEHGRLEFGGYDSVVLWHAYPRIGLDDRNQFDFYRDMPGGLAGVRGAVGEFHRAGVRVFIDYNPWDTGTRREATSDLDALCEMVRRLDVDGIFLDTMDRGAAEFRAKLDAVRKGVVLEGEAALPLDRVHDHHLSWAQWFSDSETPGVLRNKWFERRHLQHQIKRWDEDHTGELQAAWMNGSGMMVWENVFGAWVGWSQRDRSILRSMLPVQRRFARLFAGDDWTPLVPTLVKDVYASLWSGDGVRLWTLVNRSASPVTQPLLQIEPQPGERVFDLIIGREVFPQLESAVPYGVRARIGPRGIGGFVAARPEALGPDFLGFLSAQAARGSRASDDARSPARETRCLPLKPARARRRTPKGMVVVPACRSVTLRFAIRARECGYYDSVPPAAHGLAAAYEFRLKTFERTYQFKAFAMDLTPVTNAQYAQFLKATGYWPRHPENFLKHWRLRDTGSREDSRRRRGEKEARRLEPPPGKAEHPVVYVDLDDARAYARWAGKRLPTEVEWQYAAQGPDGRQYPWGNELLPGRCNGGQNGGTTPVTAFPEGRSPFGLYDVCGNVWQWTESECTDGRTRFCIIRGGSYYEARGSGWYMDGGPRPVQFAAKFLLLWPGLDRCATVGFRCAADLASA